MNSKPTQMKKILNPWVEMDGYNCFGCSPKNEWGVKMEFYEDGEEIVSHWQPDGRFQGWYNTLHGGIQATLLDEICGWVITRKLQTAGVTSKMEIKYLKPVHTNEGQITLRAHISEQRRNIVIIDATLLNEAGETCTHAVCTYFAFPPEKAYRDMHFRTCKVEGE